MARPRVKRDGAGTGKLAALALVFFLRNGLGDAVEGLALAAFGDGETTRYRVRVLLFFEGVSFSSASESSSTMFRFLRFAGGAIANDETAHLGTSVRDK